MMLIMAGVEYSPVPPRFRDSPIRWFASRYRVLLLRRAAHLLVEILRYALVHPQETQKFHVVSAQRNMGETVLRCLNSVYRQDYPGYLIEHVFIDDASTDATPEIIEKWLQDHPDNAVTFVHNSERVGMLANNLAGFRRAADTDIGIELNGDDWLPDPRVLRFLNKVYADHDVWTTYNTLRQTDGTILFQVRPPKKVRRGVAYRQSPWMTSHLHTFRMALHRRLPQEVFIDPETGEYWDLSQDMAVYLPMLELAGEHARHLHRITCTYNPHPTSDHLQSRLAQLAADRRIRGLKPYRPAASLAIADNPETRP
jgi:hypothetical protein